MKNIILSILTLNMLLTSCNKESKELIVQGGCDFVDSKYYKGKKDYLGKMSNNYLLIGIDTTYKDSQIQSFISKLNQFEQSYSYSIHSTKRYKFKEVPVKFNHSKSCAEIAQIIDNLKQYKIVSYAHYTMQTNDCNDLIGKLCINSYGSNFYVKVFDENNLTDLKKIIAETNTKLVRQFEFMPKWYELRATKASDGDALKMANYFYKTGLFEYSEPGISKYPVE